MRNRLTIDGENAFLIIFEKFRGTYVSRFDKCLRKPSMQRICYTEFSHATELENGWGPVESK